LATGFARSKCALRGLKLAQAPEDDAHACDEWKWRRTNRLDEPLLRLEEIAFGLDQFVRMVEVL
jgi:hypothetical protein